MNEAMKCFHHNEKEGGDKSSSSQRIFFPINFQPGCNDVIIGRGKKYSTHEGNKRLRRIVASKLHEYSIAVGRKRKSLILDSLIFMVRSKALEPGKFIQQDQNTKLWYEVKEYAAKEKVSQIFRDALHGMYKSSKDSRRRQRKEHKFSQLNRDMNQSIHEPSIGVGSSNLDQVNRKILSFVPSNTKCINLDKEFDLSYPFYQYDDSFETIPLNGTGNMLEPTPMKESFPEHAFPRFEKSVIKSSTTQFERLLLSNSLDEVLEDIDLFGLLPSLPISSNGSPFDFIDANERIDVGMTKYNFSGGKNRGFCRIKLLPIRINEESKLSVARTA